MTTLISSALSGWTGPLRSALLASLFAAGLAGCESSTAMLGGGDQAGPQTALASPAAPASTQTARMEIAPVIGAPEGVARDLQAQLTTSMERKQITVAKGTGSRGEYTLRGYVVAAREKAGAKISYIWDITDQAGKRAHRVTGEEIATTMPGSDPWSAVTPQIIQNIADKTATQLATWNSGIAGTPVASATPASSPATAAAAAAAAPATNAVAQAGAPATNAVAKAGTPAAQTAALSPPATAPGTASTTGSIDNSAVQTLVPNVTGAPGDGGVSLTSAIQRELSKSGVALTTTPSGTQTYKVEGKVAMGQSKDGKQPIQIDWNVYDPGGKKLGTVSQKNEVPQGSLDGSWGKTADAAAQAAAQGIVKLLPVSKTN